MMLLVFFATHRSTPTIYKSRPTRFEISCSSYPALKNINTIVVIAEGFFDVFAKMIQVEIISSTTNGSSFTSRSWFAISK